MTDFDLRTISLGSGAQSSCMVAMAALGEIGPMPDAAIFADTCAEPPHVYEMTWWLAKTFGHKFPIYVHSFADLKERLLANAEVRFFGQTPSVPFYIVNPDGSKGHLRRHCTATYKIEMITQRTRMMLGLKKRQHMWGKFKIQQWIGISTDEAHRMKDANKPGLELRYPLIEMRMSRQDCLDWMADHGYPKPGKSACTICPYHNDAEWIALRDQYPDLFAEAVEFERRLRAGQLRGLDGVPYLHASRKPLDQVVFRTDHQINLFGNECAGVCGV